MGKLENRRAAVGSPSVRFGEFGLELHIPLFDMTSLAPYSGPSGAISVFGGRLRSNLRDLPTRTKSTPGATAYTDAATSTNIAESGISEPDLCARRAGYAYAGLSGGEWAAVFEETAYIYGV